MKKQLLLIRCLLLFVFYPSISGYAQSYSVWVSVPYTYGSALTMFSVYNFISEARFTGAPYVRKVNSTPDTYIGNMTYGSPPQIYGHTSIVFQYYPSTNTINLPPGTAHVTSWFGPQQCRIYEDGTCNCGNNPNWTICDPMLAGLYQDQVNIAAQARTLTVGYLTSRGYTVTQTATSDDFHDDDEFNTVGKDILFKKKAKKEKRRALTLRESKDWDADK